MEKYGALRKLLVILLFSCVGLYSFGSIDDKENFKNRAYQAVDSVVSVSKSVGSYCQKLWLELVGKVRSYFYAYEDHRVVIQKADVSEKDDHLSFYEDYDKCTDGLDDCRYNEQFFGDTYYATGPANIDSLKIDYSDDPIVEE